MRWIGKLLTLLIIVLPPAIVIPFVHEFGHMIGVLSIGGTIEKFSLVNVEFDIADPTASKVVFMLLSGSLFTFIIGIAFYLTSTRLHNNRSIGTILFAYSCMFIPALFLNAISDIFLYQSGDWFRIAAIDYTTPWIVFFCCLSTLIVAIYVVKIASRKRGAVELVDTRPRELVVEE